MNKVTMKQTGHGMYVPSMGGLGGYVWQPDVTIITMADGDIIRVVDREAYIVKADRVDSLTEETPSEHRRDHDALAAYWKYRAECWAERDAWEPECDECFDTGVLIDWKSGGAFVNCPSCVEEGN